MHPDPKTKLTIGWKIAVPNPDIASIRYRALLPAIALQKCDYDSKYFSIPTSAILDEIDILIIVKSATETEIMLAYQARQKGVPVYYDLCDNIFVKGFGIDGSIRPEVAISIMAQWLTGIVVSTSPLAKQVRKIVTTPVPVHIIPDGLASSCETSKIIAELKPVRRSEYLPRMFLRIDKCSRLAWKQVRRLGRGVRILMKLPYRLLKLAYKIKGTS